MSGLERRLAGLFRPPAARKPDPHRKARVEAKRLAKLHGVEIEPIDSGWNVWPPKGYHLADPFEGDHYCQTWLEVLGAVKLYAGIAVNEAAQVDA